MPRQRTPRAKAELTGAIAKNPQRFRNALPKSLGPIGDPPSFLSAKEQGCWRGFVAEWSWLTFEDRASLTALCQMRAVIEDPQADKTAAFYTAYRLALSEHGGTPAARSKVHPPDKEQEENAFAVFQ